MEMKLSRSISPITGSDRARMTSVVVMGLLSDGISMVKIGRLLDISKKRVSYIRDKVLIRSKGNNPLARRTSDADFKKSDAEKLSIILRSIG